MAELFAGKPLVKVDGEKTDGDEALKGKKVVALYFSAMWCGSCRQFTPKLKRFYESLKQEGKDFEVVLVSRDREEADLLEYLEHGGGWPAIPFGDERIQEYLKKYEVPTIPALKIISSSGELLVDGARKEVEEKGKEDPTGLYEDWLAKVQQ
ncbi:unnamed protein product [Caenorhabditis auriculariae]|uniref:protein-disulfide reductase n=1 Tax=Caenorhabditis auriculariae TaxID=2777116 RepID=A0A8S1HLT9_9PELO|nr:unnamed protein product [Caenorhabditis auriculariae]